MVNALVLLWSSSSSGSAIMLIAGALQTSAPWRLSNAQSSSVARADVTAIRYPVSGADLAGSYTPVYAWQISVALPGNCWRIAHREAPLTPVRAGLGFVARLSAGKICSRTYTIQVRAAATT